MVPSLQRIIAPEPLPSRQLEQETHRASQRIEPWIVVVCALVVVALAIVVVPRVASHACPASAGRATHYRSAYTAHPRGITVAG
jgi:hypothetical protein